MTVRSNLDSPHKRFDHVCGIEHVIVLSASRGLDTHPKGFMTNCHQQKHSWPESKHLEGS